MAEIINKTIYKCETCGMEFEIEEFANLCEKRDKEMGKWFRRFFELRMNMEHTLKRTLTHEEEGEVYKIFCKGFADGLSFCDKPIEDILLIKNLYFKLKIPTDKLVLEHMMRGADFSNFPFILKKEDDNEIS